MAMVFTAPSDQSATSTGRRALARYQGWALCSLRERRQQYWTLDEMVSGSSDCRQNHFGRLAQCHPTGAFGAKPYGCGHSHTHYSSNEETSYWLRWVSTCIGPHSANQLTGSKIQGPQLLSNYTLRCKFIDGRLASIHLMRLVVKNTWTVWSLLPRFLFK